MSHAMADSILAEIRWLQNAFALIEARLREGSLDESLAKLVEEDE